MKLRDYQQEALESVINLYKSGVNSQLVVLPTGSGKTVVIASILKHFNKKALIIAHRKELIHQNKSVIEKFCKIKTGIYASGLKDLDKDIVIGSIQSCYRTESIERLNKKDFEILVIDEAHHSAAKTYRKLINGLGFIGSDKLLLGFTATPSLSNGNTLGEIYEEIAYSKQISEMIKKNHLSDVIGRKIRTGINLDTVKMQGGDYSQSALSRMIDASSRNKLIVKKYKLHANNKSIAFCASISHAKSLSAEFIANGIKSDVIYGQMNDIERKRVLSNLKDGTISVLTSVGILTEGFDMPTIQTILMARPTKSKSLYIQMVGRGLRKSENKKKCLILDFMDENHNLKQDISLDIAVPNVKIETDYVEGDICKLPTKYATYDLSHALKELEDKEFNIKGKKLFEDKNNYIETEEYINKSIRKQKSDSAKVGLNKKLQLGEWSSKAPFGYRNICNPDGSKNIIINEKEVEIVLQAYELYASGNYSLRILVKKLRNEHKIALSKSSLSTILNNPFYHGTMISKGEEYPHKYQTIMSKALFDSVKTQKKTIGKDTSVKTTTNKHMIVANYKKLISCAHCGCMITAEKHKNHIYYHCTQYKGKHGAKWIREDKITEAFVSKLRNIRMSEEIINSIAKGLKTKYKSLKTIEYEKLILYVHSLKNNAARLFLKADANEKRKLINILFSDIQMQNDKIIFNINSPFSKII